MGFIAMNLARNILHWRDRLEAELRPAAFPGGAWEREGRIPRRDLLSWPAFGLGGAALLSLLGGDAQARGALAPGDAADPPPHHPPRAKRAIHIFLCGGL